MSRRNPDLIQKLESYHLRQPSVASSDFSPSVSPNHHHHHHATDASSPSTTMRISPNRKRPKSAAAAGDHRRHMRGRYQTRKSLNAATLGGMNQNAKLDQNNASNTTTVRPATALAANRRVSTAASLTAGNRSPAASKVLADSSEQPNSQFASTETRRTDKIVPGTFSTVNPKTRMVCKVRIIDEQEAAKMQYTPQSDMMKQLFQKNNLRVYVGPSTVSTSDGNKAEERVLTKNEYLEMDDLVDVELHDVKHSIMPTSFKRLKKQKMNERIWERFQRLDAIRTNMQRTDLLLQGYEVKQQQNEPVDLLNMDDVTDLVMRDLVSRQGVMTQTRQLVESISEENKKITREKHDLLQDLTKWFQTHDIDVESLHLNSTESDVKPLLNGIEDSDFDFNYKQSKNHLQHNKTRLETIFADYKSIKDESRQEEKRKYLNQFARKMQELESNLVGQSDSLGEANAKIQLLLKKIIFLQEEVEDERELHEEKAKQSQLYRRRFLRHKGLLMKIIERLKENHIREAVDIQYIITGKYSNDLNFDYADEESEMMPEDDIENADLTKYFGKDGSVATNGANPNNQSTEEAQAAGPSNQETAATAESIVTPQFGFDASDTQTDTIESFADRSMWYTQGPDVETPSEYMLDPSLQYPLHQLSPLELKFRLQIDILNKRIMQMELDQFNRIDFDANEYQKQSSALMAQNEELKGSLAQMEQNVHTLKKQLEEKEALVQDQLYMINAASSRDSEMRQQMEKLQRVRMVRQKTTGEFALKKKSSSASLKKSNSRRDTTGSEPNEESDNVDEISDFEDDHIMEDEDPDFAGIDDIVEDTAQDSEIQSLKAKNQDVERMLESGDMSMDGMSVEQRKSWRNENYLLKTQKRQLLTEIADLKSKKRILAASTNQGPLASFRQNTGSSSDGTETQESPSKSSKSLLKNKISFKSIAHRVAQEISEKKPKKKQPAPALRLLTEQLQEQKRLKDRNSNVLDHASSDDFHILYDKNNAEEYPSTDSIMTAIESIEDLGRAKNIAKLLVLDRESLIEQVFATHKRIRKFYECMNQLYSTKSNQSVYSDSEFISEWIIFNRRLDMNILIHDVAKQYKSKENKDPPRRTGKKMTIREELKHQTTYVIDHEDEEDRKKQNPMALTRSTVGLLVRMYLHFKLFRRRKMHSSDSKRNAFSPARSHSRGHSSSGRSKSKKKKNRRKDMVAKSLNRMESHRKQMKQRWEEKKLQILEEQRNRFASYSLVPGSPVEQEDSNTQGSTYSHDDSKQSLNFDAPPSLEQESIESKRRLAALSPRRSASSSQKTSPRPRSALAGSRKRKKKARLSIDLSGPLQSRSETEAAENQEEVLSPGRKGWEVEEA